jgi:disulfide bond formation protein DsbB
MVNTVNKILAILTIASQLFLFIGIIQFSLFRKAFKNRAVGLFYKNGLKLAFLVALVATLGSLFYSEVAGFEPCKLCWFQRIFMYPLAVLLGLALIKKDEHFTFYPIWLAAIGAVISIYHNAIYNGIVIESSQSVFQCQPFGNGASCLNNYVLEFGYITIPMMALTAFSLIILLLTAQRYTDKFKKKT